MLFFSQALEWISVWGRHLIWKTFHVSHFSKWLSLGSLCKHGELLINTIKAYQKWNSTFLGNFNILSSILVQKILKSPHVNLKQFLCHNSCACFIWKNYIFFDYVERLTHLKSDKKNVYTEQYLDMIPKQNKNQNYFSFIKMKQWNLSLCNVSF